MLLMAPRRNHNNTNSSIVVHQEQLHHHQQQQQQQQQNSNHHQPQQSSTFVPTAGNQYYNSNNNNSTVDELQQFALHLNLLDITGNMSPIHQTPTSNSNALLAPGNHNSINNNNNNTDKFFRCCQPNGECFKPDSLISPDLPGHAADCVRVICNNENCSVGQYMHRACFDAWEQNLLATMKSNGSRARSWTDRQRLQNLWSKKGYDLVYKACGCKCGRGHIRKDTEWMQPVVATVSATSSPSHKQSNGVGFGGQHQHHQHQAQQQQRNGMIVGNDDDDKKKKKKRNRNSNSNSSNNGGHTAVNGSAKQQQQHVGNGYTALNGGGQQQQQQQQNIIVTTNGGSPTPNPNVGVIGSGLHHNNSNANSNSNSNNCNGSVAVAGLLNGFSNILGLDLRDRTGSLSSSSIGDGSGSTSPSDISHGSGELALSSMLQQQHQQSIYVGNGGLTPNLHMQQMHQYQQQQHLQQTALQTNGLTQSILNSSVTLLGKQKQLNSVNLLGSVGKQITTLDHQQLVQQQKVKEVEMYSERVRFTSGCNGIFSRRLDFSSFNLLPKTRLNSYQVKIEDEGNHGNDETRLFILSSLAQSQMSRVACILCEESMLVFDRYPLVDGSFFLSPKQHSPSCIEVKYEGRSLYLTCVCMSCLDGTSTSRIISCRFCGEIWDGSNLVLGTMYAYDIFAAMPCCSERLKCNNCFKMLMHPQQRLNFYSDYSHCVTCPFCTTQDTHFVKPLSYCYTKSSTVRHHPIA